MCGRFFLRPDLDEILRIFDAAVDDVEAITSPRWNVAPTQQVLAVFRDELGARRLGWFRWGLVPSWWKDPKLPVFLNARSETAASKPAFRSAWKRRRCLVPASGFYEWQREGTHKQPFAIGPSEGVMAMAGLWETWTRGPEPVRSLTVLTSDSTGAMADVHDRMPVVVDPADQARWLDPRTADEALAELVRPWQGALTIRAVGDGVNDARHSDGAWFGEAAS
ncbi:MAG: SOS response-associated peptidase [Alphaproteobacteria bacterium]|nr:SOS response-associated peptidase [Alphaproteobacteria bacterium]